MTRAKICGLTQPGDATFAAECGAAYLGVILAGGPRHLDLVAAHAVLGTVRHGVRRVAVFGDQQVDEIVRIADALALDVIQIHRATSSDEVARVIALSGRTVWPVLRLGGTSVPPSGWVLAAQTNWLVLDALVPGQLGGTGVALNWSGLADSVAALREALPLVRLVLAGGLNADNVGEAIRVLAPDVVDVSSGVESSPGMKHPESVQRFVTAVRAAMESGR